MAANQNNEQTRVLRSLTTAINSLLQEMQNASRQQQADRSRASAAPTSRATGAQARARSTTSRQQRQAAAGQRSAERAAGRRRNFNARFGAGQLGGAARGAVAGFMGGGVGGAAIWAGAAVARGAGELATRASQPLRARSVAAEAVDMVLPDLAKNIFGFKDAENIDRMTMQPLKQAIISADSAGVPLDKTARERLYGFSAEVANRQYKQLKAAASYAQPSSAQSDVAAKLLSLGTGGLSDALWMLKDASSDLKQAAADLPKRQDVQVSPFGNWNSDK